MRPGQGQHRSCRNSSNQRSPEKRWATVTNSLLPGGVKPPVMIRPDPTRLSHEAQELRHTAGTLSRDRQVLGDYPLFARPVPREAHRRRSKPRYRLVVASQLDPFLSQIADCPPEEEPRHASERAYGLNARFPVALSRRVVLPPWITGNETVAIS